ncbi:MAG TPA: DUF4861 family protein [Thermoanaerobaculia bacterium]|jgi:hypothetical protein
MNALVRILPAAFMAAGSVFAAELSVTVRNELPIARASETVELAASTLAPLGDDLTKIHVFDGAKEVLAQALDLDGDGRHESLIFQTDIGPKATRAFVLRTGEKRVYRKDDFRVYGRFNRERFDDFAWENDRVAHRMYGAALETWQKEPLTSSTVDVWLKRTRRLVINDWYMVDDYHRDTGEGADFYSAGRSRGCGGSGLWRDGKLIVSKNFRNSRVLANGPIRLVFELDYPVWDAAGVRSETKRITLDAGQHFNRFESRYDADGALVYAAGVKKEPAANIRTERAAGWLRTWGPVAKEKSEFGCAVVFDPATVTGVVEADNNALVVAKGPARYWVGSGWTLGDFPNAAAFDAAIEQWVQRVRSPLRVSVIPSVVEGSPSRMIAADPSTSLGTTP